MHNENFNKPKIDKKIPCIQWASAEIITRGLAPKRPPPSPKKRSLT